MREETHQIPPSRIRMWSRLTEPEASGVPPWDLLVIGGGITGAGILREAAGAGLRAALVEQRDFAWGTSSRSSKMVHGGLRYLMTGNWKLTRDSVQERERLLLELPGLVDPLGFLFCDFKGQRLGRWSFGALLSVYDLLAGQWDHQYHPAHAFRMLAPHLRSQGLRGGAQCWDAVTDDARLVLRTIQEALDQGALALNYVKARELVIRGRQVCGVVAEDSLTGKSAEVRAKVVVNATGAWADRLRAKVNGSRDIRPLRGSHLVFPFWRLPVAQAIGLKHPRDRRGVFLLPWEGVTVVGSTDLDHGRDLDLEPTCTGEEVSYLLEIVRFLFPGLGLTREHILSAYAGVRPVIGTGILSPSKEKRDHQIWEEQGLISVSGGKLTTFRRIAQDVLRQAGTSLGAPPTRPPEAVPPVPGPDTAVLDPVQLDATVRRRILGRYGIHAAHVLGCAKSGELRRIPGTAMLWAEMRWAARHENVIHLEDLLLRRTRLGILAEEGGMVHREKIRTICHEEMGWSEERWEQESASYQVLWKACYCVPRE